MNDSVPIEKLELLSKPNYVLDSETVGMNEEVLDST